MLPVMYTASHAYGQSQSNPCHCCLQELPFEPLAEKKKELLKPLIETPEFTVDEMKKKSMAAAAMAGVVICLCSL